MGADQKPPSGPGPSEGFEVDFEKLNAIPGEPGKASKPPLASRLGPIAGKAAIFLFFIALAFGLRIWNKSSRHDEIHAQVVKACGTDDACLAAVNRNFESCFSGAYHERRRGGEFSYDEFVGCVNQRAGAPILSLEDPADSQVHHPSPGTAPPTVEELTPEQVAALQQAIQQQNDAAATEPPKDIQ